MTPPAICRSANRQHLRAAPAISPASQPKRDAVMSDLLPSYRIRGLDPAPFAHLYGLSDAELLAQGVRRVVADGRPAFPDRVEVRDAQLGESLLLLNYTHQPAQTPFQSRYAIYVREGAETPFDAIDRLPEAFRTRTIALRAFDAEGMLLKAQLAEGEALEGAIRALLADESVAYLHAHYAAPGCYAARIDRAGV